jgi:hypothetical protein
MNNEPIDSEGIKESKLDLNKILINIKTYSSKKLCEMIVCERYFGFQPDIALICMEELSIRRTNGENFQFEDYIEKAYNELPALNFTVPDLMSVLQNMIGQKIKK